MKRAFFRIDDGPIYAGYISSLGIPHFTKEVADNIMDEVNAPYNEHHILMHYVVETDTFIYVPDDVVREYKGEDVHTVDGFQHLYAITFRWDETTLEELLLMTDEPAPPKPPKYKATAYLERCLRGAIDGIDTNDEALLDDFVWHNCQNGFTCEVIYNETGKRRVFYSEQFTTEVVSIEELLKEVS